MDDARMEEARMDEAREDKPDLMIQPPVIFIAALVVGFVIRIMAGGMLPIPEAPAEAVGGLLILASVAVVVKTLTIFAENGEAPRPATPTNVLLTSGPFRFSRNPIYLAMVAFGVGFGLATLNLWIILASLGAGAAFHFYIIPGEEAYLTRKFGVDYTDYCGKVRRWA